VCAALHRKRGLFYELSCLSEDVCLLSLIRILFLFLFFTLSLVRALSLSLSLAPRLFRPRLLSISLARALCRSLALPNSLYRERTRAAGWRRLIGCLILIGQFLQKSPTIAGSFAERDLQPKVSYGSSPPCNASRSLSRKSVRGSEQTIEQRERARERERQQGRKRQRAGDTDCERRWPSLSRTLLSLALPCHRSMLVRPPFSSKGTLL